MRTPSVSRALLAVLAILPPALLAALIHVYGVNVPYWDQWNIARSFQAVEEGRFGWSELVAQHNEHRIAFSRVLFLGLGYATGWNIRAELFLTLAVAGAVLWMLHRLGRRSLPGQGNLPLVCLALTSPMLFSLVQWDVWFWGFELQLYLVVAFLMASLLLIGSSLGVTAQFAGVIALVTLSTWTLANGILGFLLLLPALLVWHGPQIRRRPALLAVWFGALALNATVYFAGYVRPPHHPSPRVILDHPIEGLHYFLCFLGAPFAWLLGAEAGVAMKMAAIIGGLELVVFGGCLWACAAFGRDRAPWQRVLPWLIVAAFALAAAAATAVGRLGFGIDRALSSRYAPFATLFAIANVHLVATLLPRFEQLLGARSALRSASVLATLLVSASLISSFHQLGQLDPLRTKRLLGKAVLAFVRVLPDERLIGELLHSEVEPLASAARSLDRQGLLAPPLLTSDRIREIELPVPMSGYGAIEAASIANGALRASGWAALPDREQPADAVVLCYEGADGDPRAFAFAAVRTERPELAEKHGLSDRFRYYGWRADLRVSDLPPEARSLSVYAFDALSNRAYRIEGAISPLR